MSLPALDIRKVARGIHQFGSPWKLTVLAYLGGKPLRFNEILRLGETDGLNARTLSRVLKALADTGLVGREVIGTAPIAVQYARTAAGDRFGHLFAAFQDLASDLSLTEVQL